MGEKGQHFLTVVEQVEPKVDGTHSYVICSHWSTDAVLPSEMLSRSTGFILSFM